MKGMGGVCAERGCTKTITHPEGGSEISLYLIFNWRMRGGGWVGLRRLKIA